MKEQLHVLPTGDSLILSEVTGVTCYRCEGGFAVTAFTPSGNRSVQFQDAVRARQWQDEFTAQVNAARAAHSEAQEDKPPAVVLTLTDAQVAVFAQELVNAIGRTRAPDDPALGFRLLVTAMAEAIGRGLGEAK